MLNEDQIRVRVCWASCAFLCVLGYLYLCPPPVVRGIRFAAAFRHHLSVDNLACVAVGRLRHGDYMLMAERWQQQR